MVCVLEAHAATMCTCVSFYTASAKLYEYDGFGYTLYLGSHEGGSVDIELQQH